MTKVKTFTNPYLAFVLATFITGIFLFFPVTSFGQATGDRTPKDALVYECLGKGGEPGECTWEDLIAAIQKAVNWGATMAISLSVVVIAYAGFIYMTFGGSPSERARANKMFQKVGWGILAIMCSRLIVNLITSSLLRDNLKDVFN